MTLGFASQIDVDICADAGTGSKVDSLLKDFQERAWHAQLRAVSPFTSIQVPYCCKKLALDFQETILELRNILSVTFNLHPLNTVTLLE